MVNTRQLGGAATALLRTLDATGPLSAAALMDGLKISRRQLNNAARRLEIRGWLAVHANDVLGLTGTGQDAAMRGEVVTGGPKGRIKLVRNTFRARAWSAMRVQRAFTIGDIVAAAAGPDEARPRDNVARYLSRLSQAGYVGQLARRMPGTAPSSNGFKRYILLKNTGPRAPVFRAGQSCIHDPNTGEDVPCTRTRT